MTQIGIMAKLSDNIQLQLILGILVIHFELLNDFMNHSNYHAILLNCSQHHHVTFVNEIIVVGHDQLCSNLAIDSGSCYCYTVQSKQGD
jgi:hypothetical protein